MNPGQLLSLVIERPAVGGRMIARFEGRVILVAGVIPGERASVRIERIGRGVVYGAVESIEDASPDRRPVSHDPLCGGCLYAHIAYDRQRAIKAEVIADAFARIGRLPLTQAVEVAASPETGYRMRARLHLRGAHIGFFREGTHDMCDARGTGQLLPGSCDVLDRLAAAFRSLGLDVAGELDLAENVDASMRAAHIDTGRGAIDARFGRAIVPVAGLSSLSFGDLVFGDPPFVVDRVAVGGRDVTLRRNVRSFFQGNRYLLAGLVHHVVAQLGTARHVVDLYAGAGLFAVSAAATTGARVTAVEGDRCSAQDLAFNAKEQASELEAVHEAVEAFVARAAHDADVVIVDPPRTGMSREALDGVIAMAPARVVYVSCDVATLARDARRLVDAGWQLQRADAFDLFPNTPHVETVVVFAR